MRIAVRVIPRSRRETIEWEQEGLKVHVAAPPVDGAANEALIALLARRLHLPTRQISILHGASSRQKLLEIEGLTLDELRQRLT